MNRLTVLVVALAALAGIAPPAAADPAALSDPMRPVCRLGRDSATLQWFTATPCESRLQMRTGAAPGNTLTAGGKPAAVWSGAAVRVVNGPAGQRTHHVVQVPGLTPATRYYYRVYDPGAEPTGLEQNWGAARPWRREYAFSTLAPQGRKTVIRVPIKVLLMPNVINVASAHLPDGTVIPPPPRLTKSEIDLIREEYDASERFFFVNNGMRVWFDYVIVVDPRPQRWGPEPANVGAAYRGWPVSRAYAGEDFSGPGGGDFTIVDVRAPERTFREPVFGEPDLFAGQVEQAFTRRWDPNRQAWVFYGSGGGTYGMDDWPRGIPGRSQYLGGSDTAWLATHEYHHQIESIGAFSLANREDDRVIFDHFAPRRRAKRADGTWDEWVWSTSWRHGEHWDGIAYFDRMLTPVQWLRLMWGETLNVADADEDGVPDADPRLPVDEKRFGSSSSAAKTDGVTPDLAKVQLSSWAPHPLTNSWDKAPQPRIKPEPRKADSDGDGLDDTVDPYPLYPWAPFIWAFTAHVDGSAAEWADIPVGGKLEAHGVTAELKQAHDDAFYYLVLRLNGPWARAYVALEPEGLGYYTTESTYAFDVSIAPGAAPETAQVRTVSGNKAPGLVSKVGAGANGETVVEISVPNRGESLWYWQGGGREVGVSVSLTTRDRKPLSIYEPYDLFYATMLERAGRAKLPPGAPAGLEPGPGVREYDFTKGKPADWETIGAGWEWRDGALRHRDTEGENIAHTAAGDALEFDVWAEFEAKNDMHLGAWSKDTKPGSETDYVAFIGGFGNARSVVRLFGQEAGADDVGIPPGRHTMQLTRRAKQVWLLLDGKPIAWGFDPQPDRRIDRIGLVGGWGGDQVVYRMRVRTGPGPR